MLEPSNYVFRDQASVMLLCGQLKSDGSHGLFNLRELYTKLISEEYVEFESATLDPFDTELDRDVALVKECTDVIVVAAGLLVAMLGVKGAEQAWSAIQRTNAAKAAAAEMREDGKYLQTAEYKTALKKQLLEDIAKLLSLSGE